MASARKPPSLLRRAYEWQPGRLWPLFFPQRTGADQQAHRPVFLPAEIRKRNRSAPVERRFPVCPKTTRHSAGYH